MKGPSPAALIAHTKPSVSQSGESRARSVLMGHHHHATSPGGSFTPGFSHLTIWPHDLSLCIESNTSDLDPASHPLGFLLGLRASEEERGYSSCSPVLSSPGVRLLPPNLPGERGGHEFPLEGLTIWLRCSAAQEQIARQVSQSVSQPTSVCLPSRLLALRGRWPSQIRLPQECLDVRKALVATQNITEL